MTICVAAMHFRDTAAKGICSNELKINQNKLSKKIVLKYTKYKLLIYVKIKLSV